MKQKKERDLSLCEGSKIEQLQLSLEHFTPNEKVRNMKTNTLFSFLKQRVLLQKLFFKDITLSKTFFFLDVLNQMCALYYLYDFSLQHTHLHYCIILF